MSKINTDLSFLMHFNDGNFKEEMEKASVTFHPSENNELYIDTNINYFGVASICFPLDSESYISISTHDLDIKNNNDFTIEFWAYFPTNDHRGLIETTLNNEYFGWALYLILLDGKNGEPTAYISSSKVIEPNIWYHFAFVHNGNYIYLFVNGTRLGRSSKWLDYDFSSGYNIYDDLTTSNLQLNIGKSSADNTFFKDIYFNGYMDEFGITTNAKYTSPSIKVPEHVLDMLDIEHSQNSQRNIHKNYLYTYNSKFNNLINTEKNNISKRNVNITITNIYNNIYRNVLKNINNNNIFTRNIIKNFTYTTNIACNIIKSFSNLKYNTIFYYTINHIGQPLLPEAKLPTFVPNSFFSFHLMWD